jgi:hypothetical protein
MDLVKLKHKLKNLDRLGELTKQITDKIHSMPNYQELKNDLEVILYVCTIVENEIKQNKSKSYDKKQIVLDMLQRVFNYLPEELNFISKHIDFLHINDLIKKVSECERQEIRYLIGFLKSLVKYSKSYILEKIHLNFIRQMKIKFITSILVEAKFNHIIIGTIILFL